MSQLLNEIKYYEPCDSAVEWLCRHKHKSMYDLYRTCPGGDWLLWLADKIGIEDKLIILSGLDIAESVLKYTDDPRPAEAVRITRLFLEGKATIKEVEAAEASAWAAVEVEAAEASAWAAEASAWAAWAAVEAEAAESARTAARAAARSELAAAEAAARTAARTAARIAACTYQQSLNAKLVRKNIPYKLFKERLQK